MGVGPIPRHAIRDMAIENDLDTDEAETFRITGQRWAKSGDNHFLDCAVYNQALAEYLGLSTMTEDEWALIARRRGVPDEMREQTLFSQQPPEPAAAPAPPELTAEPPSQPAGWLPPRPSNWLKR